MDREKAERERDRERDRERVDSEKKIVRNEREKYGTK